MEGTNAVGALALTAVEANNGKATVFVSPNEKDTAPMTNPTAACSGGPSGSSRRGVSQQGPGLSNNKQRPPSLRPTSASGGLWNHDSECWLPVMTSPLVVDAQTSPEGQTHPPAHPRLLEVPRARPSFCNQAADVHSTNLPCWGPTAVRLPQVQPSSQSSGSAVAPWHRRILSARDCNTIVPLPETKSLPLVSHPSSQRVSVTEPTMVHRVAAQSTVWRAVLNPVPPWKPAL